MSPWQFLGDGRGDIVTVSTAAVATAVAAVATAEVAAATATAVVWGGSSKNSSSSSNNNYSGSSSSNSNSCNFASLLLRSWRSLRCRTKRNRYQETTVSSIRLSHIPAGGPVSQRRQESEEIKQTCLARRICWCIGIRCRRTLNPLI